MDDYVYGIDNFYPGTKNVDNATSDKTVVDENKIVTSEEQGGSDTSQQKGNKFGIFGVLMIIVAYMVISHIK